MGLNSGTRRCGQVTRRKKRLNNELRGCKLPDGVKWFFEKTPRRITLL